MYSHNQTAFRAQALPATAVIDQIYPGPLHVTTGGGASFDQYGMVRFEARGQPANARVLLISGCIGVCQPKYRIGQKVLVYYSPQNLSYARLRAPDYHDPGDVFGIWVLGGFAAISLFVAAVNAVTRIGG